MNIIDDINKVCNDETQTDNQKLADIADILLFSAGLCSECYNNLTIRE